MIYDDHKYTESLIKKEINKYKFLLYRSKNASEGNVNYDRVSFYKTMLNSLTTELTAVGKRL